MSDFISDFWHLYVAGITLASILACAILLYISGTTKAATHADNTTGHVWDGDLREMNNPLPKWWVYLFIITVIFGLVYGALYPMFGKFQGALGWSSQGQHAAEVKKVEDAIAPIYAKYNGMKPEDMAADSQAMAIGERLFMNYCAQCHGSDARGAKSFPNLADADWLYGGEPEQIKQTIDEGRMGVMPPHVQLGADTIKDLANYVRSLSGLPNDSVRAAKGKEAFTSAGCVGCHGPDAKGMAAIGAPNLTDKVWLYGSSEATITETIVGGRQNKMPAWKEFLGEGKVQVLVAYIYSLSHGTH